MSKLKRDAVLWLAAIAAIVSVQIALMSQAYNAGYAEGVGRWSIHNQQRPPE